MKIGNEDLLIYTYYVYIVKSVMDESYYTGVTEDLKRRLAEHNNGSSKYTSTKGNFILVWHCTFFYKKKAYDFEKYLKSGSGFAFRNKHLI
ncbi:MAG: GIY-YIG nuclease family protein [Minisyncoccia bacterium]